MKTIREKKRKYVQVDLNVERKKCAKLSSAISQRTALTLVVAFLDFSFE